MERGWGEGEEGREEGGEGEKKEGKEGEGKGEGRKERVRREME